MEVRLALMEVEGWKVEEGMTDGRDMGRLWGWMRGKSMLDEGRKTEEETDKTERMKE